MNVCVRLFASMLGVALCVGSAASPSCAQAQEKQHVVTLEELNKQAAQPAENRQANEGAIRHLLSSDEGQKALKSANVDFQRVDKAIGHLSDEEVAKLADRSRQAESDFAAGFISPKTLAYIILATVVIVVIVVLV
ncbi:MAG TPA: PA2779 family protein [Candidatus Saccharimonadales bacterium]|nr:PA2779 family protein [Candidatus Saccharimonadales bacterium]